jgi:hypothetical protein
MATLAFLPTEDSVNPYANSAKLSHTPFVVTPPKSEVRWVTHVAGQLSQTADELILVFVGEVSVHAPAIGFSRRSLRRPAVGYVLIDPVMPKIGGDYSDWPDAPVTVVLTQAASDLAKEASLQAKLRGWEVVTGSVEEVLPEL